MKGGTEALFFPAKLKFSQLAFLFFSFLLPKKLKYVFSWFFSRHISFLIVIFRPFFLWKNHQISLVGSSI